MDPSLRAMALYNWPEDFDFSGHREFLIELLVDTKIDPIKLEFEIENDKRKMCTVRKNKRPELIIREAPPFTGFEFCRPIEGNFLNLETDMTLSVTNFLKLFQLAHSPEVLSPSSALGHIEMLCRSITPQYGISHVKSPSSAATFFLGGAGTNTMSPDDNRRAGELGQYLIGNNINKPFDRLIDIFELNVLNPGHLTRQVFGQTLASWIRSKKRGELVEINSKVAVWLIPDDVRPLIRGLFFNAGLLEVPV